MSLFKQVKNTATDLKEKGFKELAQEKMEERKENKELEKIAKEESKLLAEEKEREFKENQRRYKEIFRATRVQGDIEIDESNRLLKIHNARSNIKKGHGTIAKVGKAYLALYTLGASLAIEKAMKPDDTIFSFEEIVDYDLLENDISVASGGVGRTVFGAAVAGPVGGLLGSLTAKRKTKKSIDSLALQITTSDFYFPSVMITYINTETKSKSSKYLKEMSKAKETMACLDIIFKTQVSSEVQQNYSNQSNPYEEVKKVKELLDMGIITQDEFELKKKEILGL